MKVREAVCTQDWAAFFKLYAAAPNMGRALMDMAAPSMRWSALQALVSAFKPSANVPFIARLLGFTARDSSASAADKGNLSSSSLPEAGSGSSLSRPAHSSGGADSGASAGGQVSVADKSVAGVSDKVQGSEPALQVLPGSSQAVYSGKFHPEVRWHPRVPPLPLRRLSMVCIPPSNALSTAAATCAHCTGRCGGRVRELHRVAGGAWRQRQPYPRHVPFESPGTGPLSWDALQADVFCCAPRSSTRNMV